MRSRDRAARPRSAEAFAAELERILAGHFGAADLAALVAGIVAAPAADPASAATTIPDAEVAAEGAPTQSATAPKRRSARAMWIAGPLIGIAGAAAYLYTREEPPAPAPAPVVAPLPEPVASIPDASRVPTGFAGHPGAAPAAAPAPPPAATLAPPPGSRARRKKPAAAAAREPAPPKAPPSGAEGLAPGQLADLFGRR